MTHLSVPTATEVQRLLESLSLCPLLFLLTSGPFVERTHGMYFRLIPFFSYQSLRKIILVFWVESFLLYSENILGSQDKSLWIYGPLAQGCSYRSFHSQGSCYGLHPDAPESFLPSDGVFGRWLDRGDTARLLLGGEVCLERVPWERDLEVPTPLTLSSSLLPAALCGALASVPFHGAASPWSQPTLD